MSIRAPLSARVVVLAVLSLLLLHAAATAPTLEQQIGELVPPEGKTSEEQPVAEKRGTYVTFQDRAQAMCIGLCMYNERRTYERCQRKCRIGPSIGSGTRPRKIPIPKANGPTTQKPTTTVKV